MNPESTVSIGAVLFPEFELLDIYGPLEMFGLLEQRAKITVAAQQKGPIRSGCGVSGFADTAISEVARFDALLIPGGLGIRQQLNNAEFLSDLRRLAEEAEIVLTVCTGSALLAKTGLLDARKATTNKRVFKAIAAMVPKVNWQAEARWVEDEKFFTSSGVSAGMDMALAVIAKLFSTDVALQIAARAEYEWHRDNSWDPFSKLIAT
jgi:transcriptional regulator GlxA family with amidase domain